MSSSAAAVLRRYALRRPPFQRGVLTGRQPAAAPAQNFSTRRFYSADCTAVGKQPAGTNMATVDSRELDEINRVYNETDALVLKLAELVVEKIERDERRRKVFVSGTIFAGVLAAVYVKHRFFGGTEEDKEMSAGNNN